MWREQMHRKILRLVTSLSTARFNSNPRRESSAASFTISYILNLTFINLPFSHSHQTSPPTVALSPHYQRQLLPKIIVLIFPHEAFPTWKYMSGCIWSSCTLNVGTKSLCAGTKQSTSTASLPCLRLIPSTASCLA